jgi:MoxR-like ATPase
VTAEIQSLLEAMERVGYIADDAIATAVFLSREMRKPLLVEGEAGGGKTELAKVLAAVLDTELIRLQCYEGLDVNTALYEWNYPRQLLRVRMAEQSGQGPAEIEGLIFDRAYLLERPLLRAITRREGPPVLLVDEIDRADEAFEAFLLEVLSDFQVTIPELGTIRAEQVPYVVLTSNRSREIGDALRRRWRKKYGFFARRCRRRASSSRGRSAASCRRCGAAGSRRPQGSRSRSTGRRRSSGCTATVSTRTSFPRLSAASSRIGMTWKNWIVSPSTGW